MMRYLVGACGGACVGVFGWCVAYAANYCALTGLPGKPTAPILQEPRKQLLIDLVLFSAFGLVVAAVMP